MKAVVTIINDNDEVIEKDKIVIPVDEYIANNPKNMTATKTTVFRFSITETLTQYQMMYIF